MHGLRVRGWVLGLGLRDSRFSREVSSSRLHAVREQYIGMLNGTVYNSVARSSQCGAAWGRITTIVADFLG